ncbi:MAG: TolC family protein, partial [Cyanobacteria bacterium]|nr:TolC family protein [Cyanobacteriota bacterium]
MTPFFYDCPFEKAMAETLSSVTSEQGVSGSKAFSLPPSKESPPPFHSSIQWGTLEKGYSLDKSLTESKRSFTLELQSISPLSQFPDVDWWNQFQDPYLTEMIQEAFIANQDLRLATLRLEESQGLARQLLGRELPALDFQPNFTRQRNSRNLTSFPISQGTGSGPRIFAPGQTIDIYNVPLKASYDLDLWGKKRLTTQAQQKLSKAFIQDRKAMMIKIAVEVSTAYFNLLKADSQLALLKENLTLQHDRLALIQSKYDAGLVDYTEVDLAQATLKQLEIQFPQYTQQQEVALHQLAVLIGKSPSVLAGFQRGQMESISCGSSVPVGVPSELMERRPDILAAQARLENKKLMTEVS